MSEAVSGRASSGSGPTWSIGRFLVGRRGNRLTLDEITDNLFLDHGDSVAKYQRFGLLLVLSSIIATGGIIVDSTASVIGAMIVAPLAVPIMAVALAITGGYGARLRNAVLAVVGGALTAATVGALMSLLIPAGEIVTSNPQVAGRISPGIVDLIIAGATGFVAAAAASRKDIGDVLPGVAIAISLVPPMCVVGILAAKAEWSAAFGALTLFGVNVLCMVLAGVVVFTLARYHRDAGERHTSTVDRRRAAMVVGAAMVTVLVPLGAHTVDTAQSIQTQYGATSAAAQWVEGTNYVFTDIEFLPDRIIVQITGTGMPPSTTDLLALMNANVPRSVPVVVDIINGRTVEAGVTSPASGTG